MGVAGKSLGQTWDLWGGPKVLIYPESSSKSSLKPDMNMNPVEIGNRAFCLRMFGPNQLKKKNRQF